MVSIHFKKYRFNLETSFGPLNGTLSQKKASKRTCLVICYDNPFWFFEKHFQLFQTLVYLWKTLVGVVLIEWSFCEEPKILFKEL